MDLSPLGSLESTDQWGSHPIAWSSGRFLCLSKRHKQTQTKQTSLQFHCLFFCIGLLVEIWPELHIKPLQWHELSLKEIKNERDAQCPDRRSDLSLLLTPWFLSAQPDLSLLPRLLPFCMWCLSPRRRTSVMMKEKGRENCQGGSDVIPPLAQWQLGYTPAPADLCLNGGFLFITHC